jgi:hypothetical protein
MRDDDDQANLHGAVLPVGDLPDLDGASPPGIGCRGRTQEAIAVENRATIADAEAKLAREDVQQAMIALGVDPAQARTRVSSLSDEELSRLNGQLDSLPAGGNEVLAIIGIVFLVLLILEVTGIVDIFKKN